MIAAASSRRRSSRSTGSRKWSRADAASRSARWSSWVTARAASAPGLGKAGEVPDAIRKGVDDAKKHMITVPMVGTTIPHEVRYKLGAAKVMLKPGVPGTGVISGSSMRAVVEAAGIKDILTKSLGTDNPINVVRATVSALASLRTLAAVAELRGRTPGADRRQPQDGRPHARPDADRRHPQRRGGGAMSTVRVTYRKSAIGYAWDQKATLAALGLRKLNHTVEHEATPSIRGHGPQGPPPGRRQRRAGGFPGGRGAAPGACIRVGERRREAARAEPRQGQPPAAQARRSRPGRRTGQDQRSGSEGPGLPVERRAPDRLRGWPDAAQAAAPEAARLPQPVSSRVRGGQPRQARPLRARTPWWTPTCSPRRG